MKAVILAGGKGMRMYPLTLKTPKPLLRVNGKPIIDYVIKSLGPEIDEVIVAIRYKGLQIKKYLGKNKFGKKIVYAWDPGLGTAKALLAVEKYFDNNERFIIVFGDEIPNPADITRCIKKGFCVSVFNSKNPSLHGIIYLNKDGSIKKIIEKPKTAKSKLAVAGVIVIGSDVFSCTPKSTNGEFYMSSMLSNFAGKHKVFTVTAKNFLGDFTSPSDLKRVGRLLKKYET